MTNEAGAGGGGAAGDREHHGGDATMDTAEGGRSVEAWVVERARRDVTARRRAVVGFWPRVLATHWLALLNVLNGVLLGGTVVAP